MKNTKICKGPLHPEEVELPIENFRIAKCKRTIKSNCKRFGKQFTKGEICIYFIPYSFCKKCESIRNLNYQKDNIEQTIRLSRKFQKSKKGQELHSKAKKKWILKNKDRENQKNREYRKKQVKTLSYTYVKYLWNHKFKNKGLIPPEFTMDIYIAERIRIYTNREMKKLKKSNNETKQ